MTKPDLSRETPRQRPTMTVAEAIAKYGEEILYCPYGCSPKMTETRKGTLGCLICGHRITVKILVYG